METQKAEKMEMHSGEDSGHAPLHIHRRVAAQDIVETQRRKVVYLGLDSKSVKMRILERIVGQRHCTYIIGSPRRTLPRHEKPSFSA